ncbi:putative ribonuclease H-like domain-containing protein [Tanacetum coccineum]
MQAIIGFKFWFFLVLNITSTPSNSSTYIQEKMLLLFCDKIAMIAIRMKKFYKKTGRRVRVDGKAPVGNVHQRGHMMERRRETLFINIQKAGKGKSKNPDGLLTMDDAIVIWGETYVDEETNHALMAISFSSEVSLCSKTCIDSYNTLKTLCDEQMNQLGDQEAQILAYSQAVENLKLKFTEEDSVGKPLYSRFIKTNNFKGVLHPLSGDYTPKPQEEIDESLYVYGSIGTSSEHSVDLESEISRVPQEVYVSKPITTNEKGNWGTAVKTSAGYNWRNSSPNSNCDSGPTFIRTDHPLKNMVDRGIFDSGCSGHMTGNKDQLEDFEEFNGGSVTFGGSKGYITGKGRIRVGNLDFDSVSFVKELGHFNLFSISQICDKQHKVLFTETECLVVSSDFKMPDENQILLKVPRHHNMYSFDMKTPTPAKGFACLIAKATSDESKMWHRRLGHINFKNLNKLVKGNLVRGLPSKVFRNDHTCVACHKGKQHRASCKAKLERLITEPLHTLHMDLFGPTSVKSINHASYCLLITDDCTRFSWVFFLASKDETSGILQNFIRQIENQLNHRVKIIRSDNGTEFKNRDMLEFCGNKGIKQEYSNAKTLQQNRVAKRMNETLNEAARTMLADSLLPTTFWAEAVSTACYVLNRILLVCLASLMENLMRVS